ncbi:MAG: CRISPR-associated nuclease/helicase Cas3 [Candidatus Methanofastidiosum methylothiophilum]|uniref:CRISPR-associated nuclease/helicase Cas3 n=1 Tax=Candidatus Methanofastidiosum methylothiophilum TaxID=1705564 RepID=A0A150IHJ8_9EURY|nr:MAG: CRISPR-associated nuclease/helicase Cas3 [Candidatus Methanofastidiosum methylthiophilus]KYC46658.1 MAG: CRISPR-associated nuclease/helicase Cas3 [Candidatus Methanofastidiosum methylthiophilus]KYC49076.1 MAG: CRISPR-associated nuclease/helicase Cas3 [Candidatus Methanofastidiosum methylthiophilus]
MEQKSSQFRLYSHPDKLLVSHLERVGSLSRDIILKKKLSIGEFIDIEILSDIIYFIGATHDFGKASKYFQEYLLEKDPIKKIKLKSCHETRHGLLSAIFTYYITKTYLENISKDKDEYYSILPIISFLVVKRHHGNIGNSLKEINELHEILTDKNLITIITSQINSIDEDEIKNILDKLLHYNLNDFSKFKKDYVEIMKEIDSEFMELLKIQKKQMLFYYFLTLLLYSILIDSDKNDAIGASPVVRENIRKGVVDEFKINKFHKNINLVDNIRNEIYKEVNQKIEKMDLEDKIYLLNVPTGTGKTLTSFSFAVKLKNKIQSEKGYNPRIIYSLPFLSIIDQNYSVIEEIISTQYENISSNTLLKHHHLSEIFYKTSEEEYESNKSLFLVEGWNSEIVITSFIQFFHGIISNKNRSLRKFHNIANSIVILDEIQTIPHKYWKLLNESLKFFSKYYNTYFIIVTATAPLIFDLQKNEIKNLLENHEKYYKQLNRIKLNLNLEKEVNFEEFKNIVLDDILTRNDKSFLIVLNTINSSKELFNFLKMNTNGSSDDYYYLSSNIIPLDRLDRIRKIKTDNKRKIIVSTQVIEAGVDIDIDIIYRDLAPLDSINQVAGRCNRNFSSNEKGEVNVYIIKDEKNDRLFYNYIYEGFLINKTLETLKGKKIIEEQDFFKLINDYFLSVKESSSEQISREILENLYKLEFKETGNFKLIENDYEKIDIFIEINEDAKKIWDEYTEILEIKDPILKKNKFLKIKKSFNDYIISISKNKADDVIFNDRMGYVPLSRLDYKYDLETGYKSEYSPLII